MDCTSHRGRFGEGLAPTSLAGLRWLVPAPVAHLSGSQTWALWTSQLDPGVTQFCSPREPRAFPFTVLAATTFTTPDRSGH